MPYRPKTHQPSQIAGIDVTHDAERPTACRRGYDRRWRQARAQWLADHPLCDDCERQGRTTVATVVDHRVPHRGDRVLFWDRANWQSLCMRCHNSKTARGV